MYIVKVNKDRPDFGVFIDLLYDQNRNVDTDGNCQFPSDRSWTELYIADRESNDSSVSAYVPEEYLDEDEDGEIICKEYIFHVNSDDSKIEEKVAIYLYIFCGEYIKMNGKELTNSEIVDLKQKYKKSIERANKSFHHNSSKHNT
jgi:hypothetical protein